MPPARLLVDTSVLVDHLRGVPAARSTLELARGSGHVLSSVVTRTELLGGTRSAERAKTYALIEALEWVEVSTEIADAAGVLARKFRRSHPGIDIADYLIAATAQLHDAGLATRNVKHFPMFSGLTAPY